MLNKRLLERRIEQFQNTEAFDQDTLKRLQYNIKKLEYYIKGLEDAKKYIEEEVK